MKNIRQIAILFALLSAVQSCTEQETVTPISDVVSAQDLLVLNAQTYFENQFDPTEEVLQNSRGGKGKRHQLRKNLQWDKAYVKHFTSFEGVIVPLKFDEELFLSGSDSTLNLSELSYVLIYDGKRGKKHLEVVTTIPDSTYLANPTCDFSGVVTVENWNGDLIRSFLYKDGKVGQFEDEGNEGNRTSYYCERVVDWFTCGYSLGGGWSCHYDYTEVSIIPCDLTDGCDICYVYEPVDPNDSEDESGGNSGGNNSGGNPLPELCGEGYMSDGKGGCKLVNLNLDGEGYKDLTSCERLLVDEYIYAVYELMANRELAHIVTQNIFGPYSSVNGRNDCADAFRHAFFNALNTRSWSDDFAKMWGDAHECDTPPSEYLERDMDLFNNAVGRQVATEAANVSVETLIDLVLVELESGNLRRISPLGTYNNLLPQSVLINTSSCP